MPELLVFFWNTVGLAQHRVQRFLKAIPQSGSQTVQGHGALGLELVTGARVIFFQDAVQPDAPQKDERIR